jgi:hypothetical protein
MEKKMMDRRQALKKMIVTVAAVFLCRLLGTGGKAQASPPPSPSKVDKKIAHYQNHPQDGKMCMNCRYFLPPEGMSSMMGDMQQGMGGMNGMNGSGNIGRMMAGECKIVDGPVSPMGYCRFYQEKS